MQGEGRVWGHLASGNTHATCMLKSIQLSMPRNLVHVDTSVPPLPSPSANTLPHSHGVVWKRVCVTVADFLAWKPVGLGSRYHGDISRMDRLGLNNYNYP